LFFDLVKEQEFSRGLKPLPHFARLSAGCGAPEKGGAVNAMNHRGTWIC